MITTQQSILKTAVKAVLDQKLNILRTVSQKDYVHFHSPVFNASVGGHIRHSIDHFSKLFFQDMYSPSPPVIDYDIRDRNTDVETNKDSAIVKTCELIDRLDHLFATPTSDELMSTSLSVRFVGDASSGATYCTSTTFGREVSFVAHHSMHHLATVKLLMQRMNYELPEDVGKAFATVQHDEAEARRGATTS